MNLDRIPPQNVDAERMVIGAMLLPEESSIVITKVGALLKNHDFYKESNRRIYDAICALSDSGEPVDLMTVTGELQKHGDLEKVGGVAALNEMLDSVPTVNNVEHYARLVKSESLRRKLIQSSARAYNEAFDESTEINEIIAGVEKDLMDIRSGAQVGNDIYSAHDLLNDAFKHIQRVYESPSSVIGLETGFYDLDRLCSGLQDGEHIIVAGRPSMGKSCFVQNLIQKITIQDKVPCLLFSPEMSRQSVALRFLSSEAGISYQALISGNFGESRWGDITIATGKIAEAPLFIDDTAGISIDEVRAKCNSMKLEHDIGLIAVDYIQLMSAHGHAEKRLEVEAISQGLKTIARQLNIPVIAVSQLSRNCENRPDKRPMLSDLRESGSIEQDTDLAIFLYRDKYYNKEAANNNVEVLIRKQRNGPTGQFELCFNASIMQFYNLEKREHVVEAADVPF